MKAATAQMVPVFSDMEACAACGGYCCTTMAGATFPEDFKPNFYQSVRKAMASGRWSIDWWEGDPRIGRDQFGQVYYVRPRHKTSGILAKVVDPSWEGTCNFLTETGCELPYEKRPSECRHLEPKSPYPESCEQHGHSKENAAVAWMPHQRLLRKLVEEYKEVPNAAD